MHKVRCDSRPLLLASPFKVCPAHAQPCLRAWASVVRQLTRTPPVLRVECLAEVLAMRATGKPRLASIGVQLHSLEASQSKTPPRDRPARRRWQNCDTTFYMYALACAGPSHGRARGFRCAGAAPCFEIVFEIAKSTLTGALLDMCMECVDHTGALLAAEEAPARIWAALRVQQELFVDLCEWGSVVPAGARRTRPR